MVLSISLVQFNSNFNFPILMLFNVNVLIVLLFVIVLLMMKCLLFVVLGLEIHLMRFCCYLKFLCIQAAPFLHFFETVGSSGVQALVLKVDLVKSGGLKQVSAWKSSSYMSPLCMCT